jgi:Family of unknown function (DUF6807)
MSARTSGLVVLSAVLAAAAACAAAAPRYTVRVTAANRSYSQCPVSVSLPVPAAGVKPEPVEVRDAQTKRLVPAQGMGTSVTWLVDLSQGETRTYQVALAGRMQAKEGEGVWLTEKEGAIEVAFDASHDLFTRYVFQGAPKPYCYPVIGPTGAPVTRAYPMENVPAEEKDRDHPHQRSFWFTFGEVNGIDFWAEGPDKGQEVHQAFAALESGPVYGLIRAVNDWVGPDGKKVCEDVRVLRVYRVPEARLVDFEITIRATEGPVEFGDTKEGMMGVRVATSMRLAGGQGHIVNAKGDRDGAAWGKAAEWCDYSGPVNEETVGIAIFDHPGNLRHPTYWHTRDYGLHAANPFGLKYFINDKTGAGRYTLPKGEELTFRYRLYIHRGTCEEAKVGEVWGQYADPPKVEVVR